MALVGGLLALQVGGGVSPDPAPPNRPPAAPGVRISMEALHRQGGVPLGWQLTLAPGDPAAGRQAFVDFGCPSCHQVAGESFSRADASRLGPELSGMGSHHPRAYFAEAILNPDAVLIDAPGYLGPDGRSNMPSYGDMTVGQLSDVVAYLASLRQEGPPNCHPAEAPASGLAIISVDLQDRPTSDSPEAKAFFVQTYDVLPGRLASFEAWFSREGRQQFQAAPGAVRFETFVDVTRPNGTVTSVLGFRDEAALRNFMSDPATADLWRQFDAFIGPHGHLSSDRPLVYRAASLSAD